MAILITDPDSPVLRAWLEEIAAAPTVELREDLFRVRCEDCFWFYCAFASSLRTYAINEPEHPRRLPGKTPDRTRAILNLLDKGVLDWPALMPNGGFWIFDPWMVERCNELQEDAELRVSFPLYLWARFMFKTTLITTSMTCWETLCDPGLTTAIVSWKVDQVGDRMFLGIRKELTENRILLRIWPDVLWQPGEEVPDLKTRSRFNVKREPGPTEPTISVHGLDSLPTSFHVRRITGDDLVVNQNTMNGRMMAQTKENIQSLALLCSDDTLFRFAGTVYRPNDPNLQLMEMEEGRTEPFFGKVSIQPGLAGVEAYTSNAELLERGRPVLHGAAYWKSTIGKLTYQQAGCQIMLRAIGRGDMQFDVQWLNDSEYLQTPEQAAKGKNVYFIVDEAGEKKGGDHFSIAVVGLGANRQYYLLDLWRETGLTTADLYLLLFGPEEHGGVPPYMARSAPAGQFQGLLTKWEPRIVYWEQYSTGRLGSTKHEAKRRGYTFKIRDLPAIKSRTKEGRIVLLPVPMERGEFHFPAAGFGHGSRHDDADTYRAFRRDEYSLWVDDPDANKCDGTLDTLAWLVQPETKQLFMFPRAPRSAPVEAPKTAGDVLRLHQQQEPAWRPPSAWVA